VRHDHGVRVHEHRVRGHTEQGEGLHGPLPVHAHVLLRCRHRARSRRHHPRHHGPGRHGGTGPADRLAPPGSLTEALFAFGLLLWLRLALIFVGVYLGLRIKNTEAAGNLFAVAFPLGFISSVFAPPDMMPGWLGAVAAWNPVSSTANAIRELFHTPGIEGFQTSYWIDGGPLAGAVAWPIVVMAVFLPLAVRQYRNLSK